MSWWFHKCCEGAPVCTCECACCKDNSAPCCWKVVIAGIVEGVAGDCDDLNQTYYLLQDPNDDCHWQTFSGTGPCGGSYTGDMVDLYVTCVGGTYKITVTIGAHTWEKNYGATPPTCCGMEDEDLPWTATAGDCDSTSATCVISDAEGDVNCGDGGNNCCAGSGPDFWEVTLSDIANKGGAFGCADPTACTDLNGTFLLQQVGLGWYYCFDPPLVCAGIGGGTISYMLLRVQASAPGYCTITVSFPPLNTSFAKVYAVPLGSIDCPSLAGESLPPALTGGPCANFGATCLVTAN